MRNFTADATEADEPERLSGQFVGARAQLPLEPTALPRAVGGGEELFVEGEDEQEGVLCDADARAFRGEGNRDAASAAGIQINPIVAYALKLDQAQARRGVQIRSRDGTVGDQDEIAGPEFGGMIR